LEPLAACPFTPPTNGERCDAVLVLTFHTKAWSSFAPPTCRMPPGPSQASPGRLHGSVKSQMAAAHFNCLAKERGLPYTAISRGVDPDSSIPAKIRGGLSADGLAPVDDVPKPIIAAEASDAIRVVAFDALPEDRRGRAEVGLWSDVPPATKDYAAARDAILRHIDDLILGLAERPRP